MRLSLVSLLEDLCHGNIHDDADRCAAHTFSDRRKVLGYSPTSFAVSPKTKQELKEKCCSDHFCRHAIMEKYNYDLLCRGKDVPSNQTDETVTPGQVTTDELQQAYPPKKEFHFKFDEDNVEELQAGIQAANDGPMSSKFTFEARDPIVSLKFTVDSESVNEGKVQLDIVGSDQHRITDTLGTDTNHFYLNKDFMLQNKGKFIEAEEASEQRDGAHGKNMTGGNVKKSDETIEASSQNLPGSRLKSFFQKKFGDDYNYEQFPFKSAKAAKAEAEEAMGLKFRDPKSWFVDLKQSKSEKHEIGGNFLLLLDETSSGDGAPKFFYNEQGPCVKKSWSSDSYCKGGYQCGQKLCTAPA